IHFLHLKQPFFHESKIIVSLPCLPEAEFHLDSLAILIPLQKAHHSVVGCVAFSGIPAIMPQQISDQRPAALYQPDHRVLVLHNFPVISAIVGGYRAELCCRLTKKLSASSRALP